MVKRISEETMCSSRYIIPIIFKILEAILFMCESYFQCLCIIVNPKKIDSSFYFDIFNLHIWYIDLFLRHTEYYEFGFF